MAMRMYFNLSRFGGKGFGTYAPCFGLCCKELFDKKALAGQLCPFFFLQAKALVFIPET